MQARFIDYSLSYQSRHDTNKFTAVLSQPYHSIAVLDEEACLPLLLINMKGRGVRISILVARHRADHD